MKNKKIVDYVVVRGSKDGFEYLPRDLEFEFHSNERDIYWKIDEIQELEKKISLDRLCIDEYNKLLKIKIDTEYPVISDFERKKTEYVFKYSGHSRNIYKANNAVFTSENITRIRTKKSEVEEIIKKNNSKLIELNTELLELELNNTVISSINPKIETMHVYSIFYKEIKKLLNKGYVFQGGVSVDENNTYQAMVKYED